jgi:predicted lipid-binding transport protein (Tim44 family)
VRSGRAANGSVARQRGFSLFYTLQASTPTSHQHQPHQTRPAPSTQHNNNTRTRPAPAPLLCGVRYFARVRGALARVLLPVAHLHLLLLFYF